MQSFVAVTHDGIFHADDVLAAAILRLSNPQTEFIRTRELDNIYADIAFDVGLQYDGELWFDHHQRENKPIRDDGVPYAAAGLIWEHFGNSAIRNVIGVDTEITQVHEVWGSIDSEIIRFIDAHDNGFTLEEPEPSWAGLSFARLINLYNPDFDTAVGFAADLLRRTIHATNEAVFARTYVQDEYERQGRGAVLVLEYANRWTELVSELCPKTLYFVSPDANGKQWGVTGSRKDPLKFPVKKQFPVLPESGDALCDAIGFSRVIFAHPGRFFIATKDRETAIQVAEWAASL